MIVGTTKPIRELIEITAEYEKILAVGCGTCITVCYAGGEREVAIASTALRLARKLKGGALDTREVTSKRQCEWEFVEELDELVADCDAVLSFACAAGIQALADRYPTKPVLPGVDTQFMGMVLDQGVWAERCVGCGHCITHLTGGFCAVTRCPKGMVNEPCGGETADGMCEVDETQTCIWFDIARRLENTGKLTDAARLVPPKQWSKSHAGGCRIVRKESMQR